MTKFISKHDMDIIYLMLTDGRATDQTTVEERHLYCHFNYIPFKRNSYTNSTEHHQQDSCKIWYFINIEILCYVQCSPNPDCNLSTKNTHKEFHI